MRNVPSLTSLNSLSPNDSTVWGGLVGASLVEKGCHWGQTLRLKALATSNHFFPFVLVNEEVSSQLPILAFKPVACFYTYHPSGTISPNKLLLLKIASRDGILTEKQKTK